MVSSSCGGRVGSTSPPCRIGCALAGRGCGGLVAAEPAAFVVFDLLARNGKDLRERPYWKRRRKLEKLLGAQLPDGLVLTPATTDPAVARAWM